MPLPRCYNYEAFDIATKSAWILGKPGAEATRQTADSLRSLVDDMAATKQTLDRGMADLGISWQGPAAQAAQESLDRTATGVDGTATVAQNGADRMLDHGSAFERMRGQVRFMDPAEFSWIQRAGDNISEAWQSLQGRGTDHVTIAEHNQINDEIANRALQQYESETSAIDDRFTTEAAAAPPAGSTPDATSGGGGASGPQPGVSVGANVPVPPDSGSAAVPGPAGIGLPPGGSAPPGPAVGGAGGALGGGPGGSPGPAAGPAAGSGGGPSPVVPLANGPASSTGGGGVPAPGFRTPPAPDRTRIPPRAPVPDAARTREALARRFGDQARRQQLVRPVAEPRPGGTGSYGGGTGAGRGGYGSPFGESRGTARLPGGSAEPHSPGSRVGSGTAWGTEPRTTGPRSGGAAEPWTGTRASEARGGAAGYGPMTGGVPGGRADGQDHRNRYVVPTDEVFDVGVTATDAVLAPEDPGR